MKEVTNTTKFICDNGCGAGVIEPEGYPYEKGWRYIFNFEFKTAKGKAHKIKDAHFDTARCMLEFISKKILEAEEAKDAKTESKAAP